MQPAPDKSRYDVSSYPSLTEGVYAAIKHSILTSRLAPGSKLVLEQLKDELQTGLAPVREALARLAGEGLVDTESQRGFRVPPISIDELEQLGHLRSTMEILAFRHAMAKDPALLHTRLTDAWRSFSEVGQRAGETAPLSDSWDDRHRNYHLALFCGYESDATVRIYETIYARLERYRRLGIDRKGFLAGVIDDHSRLIDLVAAGDVESGCKLLHRHIHDVVEILRNNVRWTDRSKTS